MSSPSSIESFLLRWAHPRVLVLSSPDVERLLAKNELTLTELLKPLGSSLTNVPAVAFRSVSKSYNLKHFGVKFVSPGELESAAALATMIEGAALNSPQATANIASTEAYLDSVLKQSEPPKERYSDGIQEAGDVPGFLRTTPDPTPWFTRYRNEFHEVLRYHESELIDQPLALLVAISTNDPNPLNLIEQLRSMRNLPQVFQKGIYDSPSNMLRNIVVIHDKHSEVNDPEARERGANVFRLIKKQYGTEVLRLLELNSLLPHQPNLKQKDIWRYDVERTRWQLKQIRTRKIDAPVGNDPYTVPQLQPPPQPTNPSAPAPAPSTPVPVFFQPTPPSQPSSLTPSSSAIPPTHSHPTINTSRSSLDVPHDISPEPMTPSSQSIASVSAATSAVTSNALAEMGADETATVEQEQLAEEARRLTAIAAAAANQQSSPPALYGTSTSSTSSSSFTNSMSPPTYPTSLDASATPTIAPSTPDVRGQFLSPQDLVQISAFIGDFVLKSLLPHLERKMSVLGEKVAAVRKGFKNSLKALFGSTRGSNDRNKKPSYNPRLGTYDWNTVESQARQLADLAFIVQDYELAKSTYQVCAGDYKQDKIARHFAASQEMLGLSIALGDTSGRVDSSTIRDLTTAFDSAITSYASVSDIRRSTRSAWFFADCLRWLGGQTKANECSSILLRASEKEQSIRAALCMEQAAYLFLYHIPSPLIRKYSFHLVMSGHLFHKFQQKIFGVRAYNAASFIYENRAWFSINDHLNYYLGKEYFHLGQYQESVKYFIKLIGETQSVAGIKPKQTQEKQQVFLKEFVFVVKKWQEYEMSQGNGLNKSQLVPGLKLPTVVDDSIIVRTNDLNTVPSCYTIQAWSLALRVNPLMTLTKDQCNKPLFTPGWNSYRESDRGCMVNESIHITFNINNPLLIELVCSNLRLKCKWKKPTVDGEDEVESREGIAEGQPITPNSVFTYSTMSITLSPLQTATLSLVVTPLKQGTLYVEGLLWDVMDVLKGFHPFALPMRQVTFPVVGGRRRKPELQPDPSLIVPIMPPSPLLDVTIPGFPSQLHQGEVVCVIMKLKNRGSVGLNKICLRMSHPGFMVVTPPTQQGTLGASSACYEHTWNEGYIQFPITLQPNEEVDLPLYVRGTLEGKHSIGLLLKYEPLLVTGSLKHRLAFLSFPLLVTPLFGMKVFTRASFQYLEDSLLGIELQDKQQTIPGLVGTSEYASLKNLNVHPLDVHLSQVSVLSKMWTIAPLQSDEQPTNTNEHNSQSLLAPRKISSSVSSPIVSALKDDQTPSTNSSIHPSTTTTSNNTNNGTVHPLLPSAHVLKPYESLVQFFRVTNLPGAFHSIAPSHHEAKPVHTSVSANNLAREAHPIIKPHHSYVSLSPALGFALAIDPSHPAIAHLLHMEKQLLIEEEKQTLIVNPAAILADVGAANRLDFVCCWRNSNGTRSGFYHAPGLASMKSAPSACSLKVLLSYPRHISHDFRSGFLDIPIGVSIRNTLEDAPVTFHFETLPPEEEFDPLKRNFRSSHTPALRGRYTWSGSTKCRVESLASGEQVQLQLFASFPTSGIYNLNRFRFTVEQTGKKPRVFFFPLQHLIHVNHQPTIQTNISLDLTPTLPLTSSASPTPSNDLTSSDPIASDLTHTASPSFPPSHPHLSDSLNASLQAAEDILSQPLESVEELDAAGGSTTVGEAAIGSSSTTLDSDTVEPPTELESDLTDSDGIGNSITSHDVDSIDASSNPSIADSMAIGARATAAASASATSDSLDESSVAVANVDNDDINVTIPTNTTNNDINQQPTLGDHDQSTTSTDDTFTFQQQ